jgi:class 3 adenylate cyclase/tetratricopeptide (TPR) repeat protein/TolB-like protein
MALLTMMFTDVVESSAAKRDASLGRDNRERDHAYLTQVQTPYFEMVRTCCHAHGGREVSNMGDAFFLAFDDPGEAVRCASQIQQRLAEAPIQTPRGPLRLRIGIHSGFPEFFEGSWHGTDVDTTARVESAASERQILISGRTHELTGDMADAKFHFCGEFALKGVERITLWDVDWDGHGPRRPTALPLEEVRRRRRRRATALAAAVLVALVGGYAVRRYEQLGSSAFTRPRQSVAVLGFKNLGKPEVEWLSNAVSEILGTELASSGALRVVAPEDVSIAKADLAIVVVPTFNIATLTRIRRILHSEYVVSGAYVAAGDKASDSIHIDVHLQDADSGEEVGSFAEDGSIATLPNVLKRVAADLGARLGVQEKSPAAAPTLPSDPEALRDYTEGMAKLRMFDALGARELLEKSIVLEPHLALPHFGLARTWQLLGYDANARQEAASAVELSAGLPPQEQRSIEAESYELSAKWDQAIAIYQALWVLYPDEPNFALGLANAQTSDGKGQESLGTLQKLGTRPQMKDDPRVDLFVALAAESLADTDKQRDAAKSSAEQATRQGSRLLAAHAYWQLCSAYYALGKFQEGEAACNESNRAAPFDDVIKARSQTVWANIMEAEGNIPEALNMRRQALESARKIGSQKDIIGALQNLADMVSAQGNAKEAKDYYDEAFEIARTIGDKLGLVKLENNFAGDLSANGDFAGALAMYQQSLSTAREIGDKGGIAMALENLSSIQLQQGHLTEAQNSVEEALRLQHEADLQGDMPYALRTLGDYFLVKGALADARTNYEQSAKISIEQKSPAAVAASRAALAGLELAEGRPSDAESLARLAADEFSAEKLVDSEADARNTLARALIEAGNLPGARNEVDRALKLAPQDRMIRVSLAITDARLKGHAGKGADARKELDDALDEATKMSLSGLLLEIRLAQAELEATSDPSSAERDLQKIEEEARAKGYVVLASQAQEKRTKLMR